MGAGLGDDAVGDGDDPACGPDGGEPVGDDEGGAALGQGVEGLLDLGLGDGVQGGGGLVQDQDGGILQEDPGDGHALLLAAGEEGAALTDIGVEALGHSQDILVDLGLFRSLDDLLHGGVGLAVADVLENGVGKEEHILLDDADVLVDGPLGHVPDVVAVELDGAVGDLIEPGDQLAEGGLAAAGGADDGDGLAGLHMQAHAPQDVQLAVIGEGHILHIDGTAHILQLHGIGLILEGRLRAHDVHEPVQTGEAVGEHLGEGSQLAHGVDEGGDVQGEGQKVDVLQLAAHDEPAAEADDDDVQAAEKQLHGAVEPAHCLVEVPLGGLEQGVGGAEPGIFDVLVGKSLGGADAGEAALDLGVNVGSLLLGLPGCLAHAPAHGHNDAQEQGDGQGHDDGQPPLDAEQHDQRTDDGDAGGQQILGAVVGQLRQLEEVRGQPGHHVARPVAVIVVKAQLLHVLEQVGPDIGLHPDAEGMAEIGHDELQKRPDAVAAGHDGHNGEEEAVLLIGQPLVKGGTGDQGEGQINGRDQHRTGDIQQKQLPMILEIVQKNHQRPLALIVLGCHTFTSICIFRYYTMVFRPLQAQRKNIWTFSRFVLY